MTDHRIPRPDERALARRRHVRRLRDELQLVGIPAELGPALRRLTPVITEEALTQIPTVVAHYGTLSDSAASLFSEAVRSAVANFVDLVENRSREGTSVEEVFHQVGRSEAEAQRGLDTLHAAHVVAAGIAWEVWATHQTSELALHTPRLGTALNRYLAYLLECARSGHNRANQGKAAVNQLLRSLFDGEETATVEDAASRINWPFPTEVHLCVQAAGTRSPGLVIGAGANHGPPSQVLEGKVHKHPTLVARSGHELVHILQARRACPAVVAGPVPIADLPRAHRTARLTLQLMKIGVVEPGILHCPPSPPASWMHDPSPQAAQELKQQLLPFIDLTRHQRATLGRTQLHFLRSRDSSRRIAEALNVHRGTVQNRLRHLRNLFGGEVPQEQTLPLLSALELVVPLWEQQDPTRDPRQQPLTSLIDARAMSFIMSRKL